MRIAEITQLQKCSAMCTKNEGNYCENEKREKKSGGGGGGQGGMCTKK